jgi:quercetin dioxygenase-like cupin family protein
MQMPFCNEEDFSWNEPPGHVRGYSRYLVGPHSGSKYFDFRTSRYPTGGRVDPHVHDVAEQVYYFISGTGRALCGEQTRTVGAGDVMFVPAGIVHSLECTSEDDLKFVVVTTPPDDIAR